MVNDKISDEIILELEMPNGNSYEVRMHLADDPATVATDIAQRFNLKTSGYTHVL